jgi:hypothetical protein
MPDSTSNSIGTIAQTFGDNIRSMRQFVPLITLVYVIIISLIVFVRLISEKSCE